MIRTDDVVILNINDKRYVTLVTEGQKKRRDPGVRVLNPEDPGAGLEVPVRDVELLTQELAEEILGA